MVLLLTRLNSGLPVNFWSEVCAIISKWRLTDSESQGSCGFFLYIEARKKKIKKGPHENRKKTSRVEEARQEEAEGEKKGRNRE